MRKLRMTQHMSLDGVIQQTADETGFPYTDWTVPYRTPAGRELVTAWYGERFDLLLGRRTYNLWADFWPAAPRGPLADGMNAATKYVATHRKELPWGPAHVLEPEPVDAVRELKLGSGPDLILAGSSTLTSVLLESNLVDELWLVVYPVLLGTGKRLFADGTPAQQFEHIRTQALPSGVVLTTYHQRGPLRRG